MWKSEHSVDTEATPEQIWARYVDVSTWDSWYPDVKKITLDGPFQVGTTGRIEQDPEAGHHPQPVPFKLTEVVENKSWTLELMAPTSETGVMDEIAMSTSAVLVAKDGGGTTILHRTELIGPGSEEIGQQIGPWISSSLATGVEKLAKIVAD